MLHLLHVLCTLSIMSRNLLRDHVHAVQLGVSLYCAARVSHPFTSTRLYLRVNRRCGEFLGELAGVAGTQNLQTVIYGFSASDQEMVEMCIFMGNVMPLMLSDAVHRQQCVRIASLYLIMIKQKCGTVPSPLVGSLTVEMEETIKDYSDVLWRVPTKYVQHHCGVCVVPPEPKKRRRQRRPRTAARATYPVESDPVHMDCRDFNTYCKSMGASSGAIERLRLQRRRVRCAVYSRNSRLRKAMHD